MKTLPLKKISLITLSAVFILGLTACNDPKNPEYTGVAHQDDVRDGVKYGGPTYIALPTKPTPPPPPEKVPLRIVQDDELTMKYNSKLDVLFVMDNSNSMTCDQNKLTQNIDMFTNAFLNKGKFLDFRVGVVSIWDSKTFGSAPRDCELGELRPVGGKKSKSKGSCSKNTEINYVTRDTANKLGDTLKLGIEQLTNDPSTSGPQFEESFSPVFAVLSPEGNAKNHGFRRDKEAHLAVIWVTDGDDETPDASQDSMALSSYLNSMATDDLTVTTYAILGRYNDLLKNILDPARYPLLKSEGSVNNCKTNKVDPLIAEAGGAPRKMFDILERTKGDAQKGNGFDFLDKNYGEQLAGMSEKILRKVLEKKILLKHEPDFKFSIVVKYGKQLIPENDSVKGWTYDAQTITIHPGVKLEPEANARITIEYNVKGKFVGDAI